MTSAEAQLSPRDIILEIGRNMNASCMPLISRIIVPSLYEVFLQEDDYHTQEPVFRLMREEAALHLTAELEKLNSSPSRLPAFLKGILGGEKANLPYQRDEGDWTILFRIDPDGAMPRGAVLVSSRIQVAESGSGAKTRRVLTERFSGDARTINDDSGMSDISASPRGSSEQTMAYLFHRDEKGENRKFPVERSEVSIGRGGDGKWVDLQLPSARSVSKEHLLIRYDAQARRFEAQDVSTNGTRMDGNLLPPKTWTPIGATATFELAKGVVIEFKALR